METNPMGKLSTEQSKSGPPPEAVHTKGLTAAPHHLRLDEVKSRLLRIEPVDERVYGRQLRVVRGVFIDCTQHDTKNALT